MRNKNTWLIVIALLVVFSVWVDFSNHIKIYNPINDTALVDKDVKIKLGLDLRGGLQALLEADVPAETKVDSAELENAKNILQNRANALGVSEISMQTAGDRRIVAEFPGITNPEEVVAALKQTALLEFVDMGTTPIAQGTIIKTDFGTQEASTTTATPAPGTTPSPDGTQAAIYHTVMTGAGLQTAAVGRDQSGRYLISFVLKSDAKDLFGEYTTSHQQQYLGIVLDKTVVSAPIIQQPITDGQGQISGSFTQAEAQTLFRPADDPDQSSGKLYSWSDTWR